MSAPPPHHPRDSAATVELSALVALTALVGMGPRRLRAVLDEWAPVDAWEALLRGRLQLRRDVSTTFGGRLPVWLQRWRAQALAIDPAALLAGCDRLGVTILPPASPAYPARLRDDPDPPALLYARGDLRLLDADAVAVVGTRAASAYGLDVAFELGAALAEAGVAVVSGLAAGIDGSAHRGALSSRPGCGPVGVVGSGLDVVYPKVHTRLWEQVAERGLLLSEAPPGVAPEPWRFPSRNRIIAALSRAVVVVESPEHGGSMITADEAMDREIPVLAVPGSVRSPVSVGPHRLIFDGCGPARGPDDVLGALGRFPARPQRAGHAAERRARSPLTSSGRRQRAVSRTPSALGPLACPEALRTGRATAEHGLAASETSWASASEPDGNGARWRSPRQSLSPDQHQVLDALGWEPASLDELIERSGLALGRVALAVEELHERALVERQLGFVRRTR